MVRSCAPGNVLIKSSLGAVTHLLLSGSRKPLKQRSKILQGVKGILLLSARSRAPTGVSSTAYSPSSVTKKKSTTSTSQSGILTGEIVLRNFHFREFLTTVASCWLNISIPSPIYSTLFSQNIYRYQIYRGSSNCCPYFFRDGVCRVSMKICEAAYQNSDQWCDIQLLL